VIALYRVDDRLVHGQVVLGWGQSLHADFIVLADTEGNLFCVVNAGHYVTG
jgi:mannose/fructose/N-acetylgalactosamine-specific phosphotransferase system component IIB